MPNEYKDVENTLSSALRPDKELRPEASAAMDERVNNTIHTLKTMQNENEVQNKISFFAKVKLGLFATRKRKLATFSVGFLMTIPLILVTLLLLTNGNSPIFRRQETLESASADFAASKVTGDGVAQDSEFTLRTELDYSQDELKEQLTISPSIDFEVEKISDGYKISPLSNLQKNVLYEVELAGEDMNLNWNFRVEPGFSVLSHSPAESAVPVNSTIEFNFNYSDIDLDTVGAAFKSSPIINIKEIKQEGRTVILVPESQLSLNDSYSIYLDNTVKRKNGETLSVPYQAYLSTYNSEQANNYPPAIYFERSGNEKLLNAERKVVFSVSNYKANVKGNVKMYKIKNDTFLDAAKEYFSINGSYYSYRLDSKYLEQIKSEEFVPSQNVVVTVPEVSKGEMIYVEASYMGSIRGDYYLSTDIMSHMTYMQNELVLNVFDSQGKVVNEGSADILFKDNNNQVQSKTFPITGIVRIPKSEIPAQESILGAVITASGDRLVLSMTSNYVGGSYYGYDYESDSAYNKNIFSYFMMDKPVYTEGDKVQFKTQFRYSEDFTNFQIYDVSGLEYIFMYGGSIISKSKPEYNKDFGYVTGEFNVPAAGNSVMSGTIQVVRGNKIIATKSFPIREYVKPQYTVSINADDSNKIYHPGDEVKFRVTVNDLAGNPWSGGEVQADFGYSENYRSSWIEENSINSYHYLSNSVENKTVKLDAGGLATLVYKVPTPELSEQTDFFSSVLQVNVGKHSNKSYGVRSSLGDTTIMAKTVDNNSRKKPGEEVKIRVKTVDAQTFVGVSRTIDKIEVVRHWSQKIPKTYYNSYTRTNEITYDYIQHEDIVDTQYSLKTDENGELELVKKYDLDGSYFFKFEFKDKKDRPVRLSSSIFYINGEDEDTSAYYDNAPVIFTDKNVYKIGEKVNIRVEFPDKFLDGREAYLFVYKDKIYKEEKITVTQNVYNYSYELTKELSPQAGIRLVYTLPVSSYGAEYANESYKVVDSVESSLVVRRDEDLLNVEISTEKKEYFPGEEVKMKIKVTDENGRTVSGANLNTRVFDKSLLAVIDKDGYEKDIYNKVFGVYRRIGSLFTFPKAPYWGDGGDGGQGPDGIRRNFDDVATFQSNLITDNSGNAELNFTIPESITTWIVDVDAFTKKLNVGNSFIEVTTNKDVIVNGTFPETVRIGDKISPKVVIYNHTDSPISGKLVITAGEGLVLSNSEQNVKVEPRSGGTYSFGAEAKQSKNNATMLTIKLLGAEGIVIDGIEKPIEVKLPGFPTSSVESNKLNVGANEIKFNVAGDLDRTSVSLLVSPNAYRHAFFTKDIALNSSEERASSIIHNLAIYDNYQKGQGVISMSQNTLLDQIAISSAALVDTENEDGGYGMFGYSPSDINNSTYVAYALGKGSKSGAGNSFNNNEMLAQFLISQIVTNEGKENDDTTSYDKTMAVWALSYIDPSRAISYAQLIKSQLQGDESWAELSLLADALYTAGSNGDARAITQEIIAGLQENELNQMFIEEDQPYSDNRYFANIMLWKMLNEINIDDAAKEKVGNWMMANTESKSAFESALINEMLLNYGVQAEDLNAEVELFINEIEVYKGKVSEFGDSFILTGLKTGENVIRITSNKAGLKYLLKLSEVTQGQVTSTDDFTVKTEYMPLETMVSSNTLTSSQYTLVRLTVTSKKEHKGYNVKTYLPAGIIAGSSIPNLYSSDAYYKWLSSNNYINKWPQVYNGTLSFNSYYDAKKPTQIFEYLLVTDHKGVYGTDGTYVFYDDDTVFRGYDAGKTITIN